MAIAGLARPVKRGLAGIVVARLAINGGIRVVYPFLPVIANGLGLSLQAVALLVASRSLAGLAGPLIARIVAPCRQRAFMLGSQVVVFAGCLLIAASAAAPMGFRIAVAGVGFVATGVARPLFDLPMQTWVSAHVPVADRGRALGLTELGWALSLAATVPVAGVLIGHGGWQSPFLLVAVMAVAGMLALVVLVPREGTQAPAGATHGRSVQSTTAVATWKMPTALAVCAGAGLAVAAGESVLVIYGEWLTEDFGMSVAQIGASTLMIVAAELLGEGLVVAVSDRIGLRRTLFSALLVSTTMYVMLGLIGNRVGLAVMAISTLFVAFEVTVVVLVAFASIVVHRSRDRARLLGALMTAVACGNAAGAALAPLGFAQGGIALAGAASAFTAAAAAAFLWLGSRSKPVVWSLS